MCIIDQSIDRSIYQSINRPIKLRQTSRLYKDFPWTDFRKFENCVTGLTHSTSPHGILYICAELVFTYLARFSLRSVVRFFYCIELHGLQSTIFRFPIKMASLAGCSFRSIISNVLWVNKIKLDRKWRNTLFSMMTIENRTSLPKAA